MSSLLICTSNTTVRKYKINNTHLIWSLLYSYCIWLIVVIKCRLFASKTWKKRLSLEHSFTTWDIHCTYNILK
jgi:formate/nitrite transporter FocA (FNT family)